MYVYDNVCACNSSSPLADFTTILNDIFMSYITYEIVVFLSNM